jgi:shikimate kinase
MDNMDNIILIGMPGAGKSTLGKWLAKEIGFGFIDSDLVIQSREGRSLSEIIARDGLDGFLKIEGEVNAQICAERCVIATGGSVVYSSAAMKHLKSIGRVVYLKLPYAEIEKRLSDLKGRGVAIKEGYTLKMLYEERVPLYEKYADVVADLTDKDMQGGAKVVWEALS